MSDKKIKLPSLSSEQKKELLCGLAILFGICVVAAILLCGTNLLVSDTIEANVTAPVKAAMQRVLPASEYRTIESSAKAADGVSEIYEAYDGETLSGYCVISTASDYDGEVELVVAVDKEDKVIAVEIISMTGNAGVGSKVNNSNFLGQFAKKGGKITAVKSTPKGEAQIAAVSGATASSNAVTEGVNRAIEAISQLEAEKTKEAASA